MHLPWRLATFTLFALFFASITTKACAVTIDWVTVGDPDNAADDTGYGAVSEGFRIMEFEWTNSQYAEFLNAVDPDGTNPQGIYNSSMGSNARGGINKFDGNAAGSKYAPKTNMGDKPVTYVSWFDAARVANWLHNGGKTYETTDSTSSGPQNTGAYAVGTATSGDAPARSLDALYYVPTENQWYKAAYYKGGSTNAGYWEYGTGSDTAPSVVSATSTGDGTAGPSGNSVNYSRGADWNGQDGNVTTVGTNGGTSAYGAFDMSGNVYEWNDLTGASGSSRGLRGGAWYISSFSVSSASRLTDAPSFEDFPDYGFRLASPVPVPEPATWVMGLAGIAYVGWLRRRCVSLTGHRQTAV